MTDPARPFSEAHPFAGVYEEFTLEAILQKATDGVDEVSRQLPELYHFMHRARIACAGERKTRPVGDLDIDHGYCICFA